DCGAGEPYCALERATGLSHLRPGADWPRSARRPQGAGVQEVRNHAGQIAASFPGVAISEFEGLTNRMERERRQSSNGKRQEREKSRTGGRAEGAAGRASQRQGNAASEGALQEGSCAHADEGIRPEKSQGGPASAKDRGQNGCGKSPAEPQGAPSRRERAW